MSYIVVGSPSLNVRYNWSMKDSLDGVLYDNFGQAFQQCKILNASGVVEIGHYAAMKEIENAKAGNDKED